MNSKLSLETLETREVPAVVGGTWANADRMTMSFAPDWTAIAGYSQDILGWGQPSRLFSEMSSVGTTTQWQTEILRAFQTWAAQTNINIGLVRDDGGAFGSLSQAEKAGSSGDIRVGAFYASPDVIAINQALSPLSGAWSGDLLYNTAKDFSIGAVANKFDLFSVTLNEAANIYGLADIEDKSSARYGHYIGVRSGLSTSDVTAIRNLYGVRTGDMWEGNETLSTARRLSPYTAPTDSTKRMVSAIGADLTTLTDVDHYVFKTSSTTSSLTIRLETAGISLLNARVSVYDDKNNLVATASSTNPLAMRDIVFTIDAKGGKDYRIRVEKATNDVFGIGRYNLRVGYNFDPVGTSTSAPPPVYIADSNTNDTRLTATDIFPVTGSANTLYQYNGTIHTSTDVDVYRIVTPYTANKPMTITVDPASPYGLYTNVTVYDAFGSVVQHQILANGADGRFVVQVANPQPAMMYYIQVNSVGRGGFGLTGKYTLNVDFTQAAVELSTVATGTLNQTVNTDFRTFSVPEAKLFHFTLSATTADTTIKSGVRLIVYNAEGRIVATLTADAGQTTSGAIFLNSGTYYLKFEAAAADGKQLPDLKYALNATVLSDPIDPFVPLDPLAPPPPDYTVTTDPNPLYLALQLVDPWLTPWQP
jgi:hypothetical protein